MYVKLKKRHSRRKTDFVGDVGGQKTLRSYWRNYFEKTDALIWIVDATDRIRIDDCREELQGLLLEEVTYQIKKNPPPPDDAVADAEGLEKRLSGASLLVFVNKTDVDGCMTEEEVYTVSLQLRRRRRRRREIKGLTVWWGGKGTAVGVDTDASMAYFEV